MIPEPINEKGPKCVSCGVRPDDPMWVVLKDARSIMCLGCVGTGRHLGVRIRVVARVNFTEGA